MELKVICAWCTRVIQEPKEGEVFQVTHGICPVCYEKQSHFLQAMKPTDDIDHSVDMGGEG